MFSAQAVLLQPRTELVLHSFPQAQEHCHHYHHYHSRVGLQEKIREVQEKNEQNTAVLCMFPNDKAIHATTVFSLKRLAVLDQGFTTFRLEPRNGCS